MTTGWLIRRWMAMAVAGSGVLAACFMLAGCGPAGSAPMAAGAHATLDLAGLRPVSSPGARIYVGAVTGTHAVIGVVVNGGYARAYVCDGIPGRAVTLADWFSGPVHASRFAAVSGQHRVRLVAQLAGRRVAGTVTLADGWVFRFAAALADGGPRVGVFAVSGRLHGRNYHAGRIVLPDGEQRGAAAFAAGYYPLGPVRSQ